MAEVEAFRQVEDEFLAGSYKSVLVENLVAGDSQKQGFSGFPGEEGLEKAVGFPGSLREDGVVDAVESGRRTSRLPPA